MAISVLPVQKSIYAIENEINFSDHTLLITSSTELDLLACIVDIAVNQHRDEWSLPDFVKYEGLNIDSIGAVIHANFKANRNFHYLHYCKT